MKVLITIEDIVKTPISIEEDKSLSRLTGANHYLLGQEHLMGSLVDQVTSWLNDRGM